MVYENFLKAVGNTPVIKSRTDFEMPFEVYIKLEGYNPTGSVKDRAALNIISDKIETGELTQGKTILDGKEGFIKEELKYGVAKSAIARKLGVSRGSLFHFIKTRGLETK